MLNETRTYRHPPFQLLFTLLLFGFLAFFLYTSFDWQLSLLAASFGLLAIFAGLYSAFTLTGQASISDAEISSRSLLGTRTLAWSEIHRVSGSGNRIRLHNSDGDVTVSPSPHLPAYEEIVEWIGVKRPDLFNPHEHSYMTRNWAGAILPVLVGLSIMGMGWLISVPTDGYFVFLFSIFLGLFIVGNAFASPQSVTLDGHSMTIRHLFKERTLSAGDIQSVELSYYRTRNGKRYFVLLHLPGNKAIKITGLSPSLPIVYHTLKNWHNRSRNRLTT
jgi:uncharacterized protein (DUF58 family)